MSTLAAVMAFSAALAGFIGFLVRLERRLGKAYDDLIASFARRLDGEVAPFSWRLREVRFRLAGLEARLQWEKGDDEVPGATRVVADMRGRSRGILKINPEGVADGFAKFFGRQDLKVGHAEFDALYRVQAEPPDLAGRVFSPERRERVIRSVRRLGFFEQPRVDLSRDALTVSVAGILTREADVEKLLATAGDFLEYLDAAAPGDRLDALVWKAGSCPVCASSLGGAVVSCARCATPHHGECWTYAGRCATYGCGGRAARP